VKGFLLVAALAAATPAHAQSRFEIGAGMNWTGGFDAGGSDALLTRNPGSGPGPFTLFGTSSRVTAAPGVTLTVGFNVSRRILLEAAADYSRPVLATTIANDVEQATGAAAESRLRSFVAGGSVLYQFGTARVTPFAFGGAAWLRQLDQDSVMLVTGAEVHAGGGATYRLDRHFAIRARAGVSARDKSIAFEEKRRAVPQASGCLIYRW
jgi:hypothetical protein